MKKTGQKTVGVQLRPLAQLEYKEIDVDYLYISAYKGRYTAQPDLYFLKQI